MRRLQIMIDEELDHELSARARRDGTSKAELLRSAARERYLAPSPADDPLLGMAGIDDVEPLGEEESIDDIVYG